MSGPAPAAPTTIVVPTLGRPSLVDLCVSLARQTCRVDVPVLIVDDRNEGGDLATWLHEALATRLRRPHLLDMRFLRSGGGGPARARNLGWRHARTPWVSFLDDDVVVGPGWYALLRDDLATAEARGAVGSSGWVHVPLPTDRRPTDWERSTAGLETSQWITADLSYHRDALSLAGGFDERFPRAFREDADLALRLGGDRGRIVVGERRITHPVRPADDWVSVRQQAGNADDVLMRRLHGPDWSFRAGAPAGRRTRHLAVVGAAVAAVLGMGTGRRRLAMLAGTAWLAGTLEFAAARVLPGPRDRLEVRRMLLTSAAIPFAAAWHYARGLVRHRHPAAWRGLPDLVLLDRDGTLVHDVPYNADPDLVRPLPGAREALDALRADGVRLAVVTNQSGVARGRITEQQLDDVHQRVTELLGPFDGWYICPHGPDDDCGCRKPAPGLVKQACADLGVDPARTVLVGDIGSDVSAAHAAGVSAFLVPTAATRTEEVAAAPRVRSDLTDVVAALRAGDW